MNKISIISENTPVPRQQKTNLSQKGAFEKSLAGAMESNAVNTAGKPTAAALLGEVQPVALKIENSPMEVVDKTGTLLDMLDAYSREIEDPKRSLKEIEPLISEIKDKASRLMAESQDALARDDRLKEIATRCALTANVEYIKFKRGDYI